MSKFFKTYLPAISMAFTFIMLYSTIRNISTGHSKEGFCFFILEVISYLVLSVIIDWIVSMIDFSKYIYHFFIETIALYPITIGFVIIGRWFTLNTFNIIWYSCLYVIAMIALHYYFYFVSKKQADDINSLLQKKKRSDNNGRPDEI